MLQPVVPSGGIMGRYDNTCVIGVLLGMYLR